MQFKFLLTLALVGAVVASPIANPTRSKGPKGPGYGHGGPKGPGGPGDTDNSNQNNQNNNNNSGNTKNQCGNGDFYCCNTFEKGHGTGCKKSESFQCKNQPVCCSANNNNNAGGMVQVNVGCVPLLDGGALDLGGLLSGLG